MKLPKLQKISYDQNLTAFNMVETLPCDDRLMTKVTLDDYDWMSYKFETWFPTKEQGFLSVLVEYEGIVTSTMTVTQKINDKQYKYVIGFNSDIFKDFIKDFLTKHIKQWDDTYAFCGEEEAVSFYNKILDNIDTYDCTEERKG